MTIREVAKRAGVSLQTVSNVLNGRTSQMGAETRERVLRSMAELDYLPNAHARGLRSQRASTLGFFTLDPAVRFLADPFHTIILSGMADVLREQNYCLLVQALPLDEPGESFTRLYRQRRFDGGVVHLSGTPAERARCVEQLKTSGCPFVLIEEKVEGPRCASVRADNRQGAESAVAYLHARGHQRIAFLVADRSWPAVEERHAGYQAGLRSHRLPVPRPWQVSSENVEAARAMVAIQLQRPDAPTAVVCANDVLALGSLQAAKQVGRRIPNGLAIIGFDDVEFAQHVEPPLTTLALPGYDMGRRAAELLLDYLQEGRFAEPDVVFPTRLIERGTA